MKTLLLVVCSIACLAFLPSCANPINAYTAQRNYEEGIAAQRRGDFASARRSFSRAHGNAQIGNLGPKAEAYYLYEYARASGYAGSFSNSEEAFLGVILLIEASKGEADNLLPPTLSEYARLLHDTKQHSKAVEIFDKAVVELERVGIEEADPVGFASFLDDYATSLDATDFSEKSVSIASRAASIRDTHKGAGPGFTPRRYCPAVP